mmetsp:Transcript_109489/g.320469  ORF Transcript_109489/g.320469 Transcript_109489/m.320469 type:complete len:215 (+) Transcript_109489:809-1453(+)
MRGRDAEQARGHGLGVDRRPADRGLAGAAAEGRSARPALAARPQQPAQFHGSYGVDVGHHRLGVASGVARRGGAHPETGGPHERPGGAPPHPSPGLPDLRRSGAGGADQQRCAAAGAARAERPAPAAAELLLALRRGPHEAVADAAAAGPGGRRALRAARCLAAASSSTGAGWRGPLWRSASQSAAGWRRLLRSVAVSAHRPSPLKGGMVELMV